MDAKRVRFEFGATKLTCNSSEDVARGFLVFLDPRFGSAFSKPPPLFVSPDNTGVCVGQRLDWRSG